jgi:hypothetical protein
MRILMSLLIAVFLMGGQAVAKTPDGETPAEEDVCVAEEGVAYGLCNAYCEAMDCDSEYPQASKTACTRVLELYKEHNNDFEPPCVKPGSDIIECRCFTEKDIKWISHKKYECHEGAYEDTQSWIYVYYEPREDIGYHVERDSYTGETEYWCGTWEDDQMVAQYIEYDEFEQCWDLLNDNLYCPTKPY